MEILRAYVHHNGQRAALVGFHCDTDLVARNEEFLQFCDNFAMGVCTLAGWWRTCLWKENPVTEQTFAEDIFKARKRFGENIYVTDVILRGVWDDEEAVNE